jgi:hypothetical protein
MLSGTMVTTNIIFVTINGHGLTIGNPVYLNFTTAGGSNGLYQIITSTNGNTFAVATADNVSRSGNCLIQKWTSGGFTVALRTNITISTTVPHGLNPGDNFYAVFTSAGSPTNGQYQVASIVDPLHFTFNTTALIGNGTYNGATWYPLVSAPLARFGNVSVQWNTWGMGITDGGTSSSLSQSPLRSPTVFNFFPPDYHNPGILAAAGLTTPEFQLTSDTEVIIQMNFIEGGLLNNTANTNGLSSYTGGNGSITLDLGPWMTSAYTQNTGIASLVDALNSLLCAGQLSPAAKTVIVNHVANNTNYPYTPTVAQMRDRVRAVVHLIVNSPEFIIQK